MYKYEEEFRKDAPQTIGETDKHFDLDNYKDWLEYRMEILETQNKTMLDLLTKCEPCIRLNEQHEIDIWKRVKNYLKRK